MNQLIGDLILFTSLSGIFLSLLLLYYIKYSNKGNIYLSVFLFRNALFGITTYVLLGYSGSIYLMAIFYGNLSPLYFLLAPSGFFYIRSILRDDARLSRRDAVHFIPFAIQLVNMLPYIFTSFEYKVQTVAQLTQRTGMIPLSHPGWFLTPAVNYLFRPLYMLGYSIAQCILLFKWSRNNKVISESKRIMIRWLYFFNATCLFLFGSIIVAALWWAFTVVTGNTYTYAALHHWTFWLQLLFIPFIILNGLIFLFPQILYGLPKWEATDETAKVSKKVQQLNEETLDALHKQIAIYHASHKPFLQKEFSLAKMSVRTGIPVHHLSYYFNYYLEEKFTDWRNRHRVAYAVELIRSGEAEKMSLEGIAMQSGFSSRTTFFIAFKNEIGVSPSQYLENTEPDKQPNQIVP